MYNLKAIQMKMISKQSHAIHACVMCVIVIVAAWRRK